MYYKLIFKTYWKCIGNLFKLIQTYWKLIKTYWKLMLGTMKKGHPYTMAVIQQLKHILNVCLLINLKLIGNIPNLLQTYENF